MNAEHKKQKEQYEPIYFTDEDFKDVDKEHDDPMEISVSIHNFLVQRVLVNQGSLVNVLFSYVIEALGLQKSMYKLYNDTIVKFIKGQV